jgi:hypothetical protein
MNQIIRELKRQAAGEKLAPEQLKGLIRAGYVYRTAMSTSSPTRAATPWLSSAFRRGCILAEGASKSIGPSAVGGAAPPSN